MWAWTLRHAPPEGVYDIVTAFYGDPDEPETEQIAGAKIDSEALKVMRSLDDKRKAKREARTARLAAG